MKSTSLYISAVLVLNVALLAGCGESKSAETKTHDSAAQKSHDHDHREAGAEISDLGLFRVSMEWAASPVVGQAINQAQVMLFNPAGESIEGVLKGVHPWMPAMGHGANESAIRWQPAADASHTFAVSGIFFNMGGAPGEWVIRLVVAIDGVDDQIIVPVAYEVK